MCFYQPNKESPIDFWNRPQQESPPKRVKFSYVGTLVWCKGIFKSTADCRFPSVKRFSAGRVQEKPYGRREFSAVMLSVARPSASHVCPEKD